MPIYVYCCDECGNEIEIMQSFGDQPPLCCDKTMRRKISRCAFHLKGMGWTDGYNGGVGENPQAKKLPRLK